VPPWHLNLQTKRGQEEKLGFGVAELPRAHKQMCIKNIKKTGNEKLALELDGFHDEALRGNE
jgi:hypothetical protein